MVFKINDVDTSIEYCVYLDESDIQSIMELKSSSQFHNTRTANWVFSNEFFLVKFLNGGGIGIFSKEDFMNVIIQPLN